MPPTDIERRTTGRVTVHVHFAESGFVEKVVPVESSSQSLLDAVLRAVSTWQIEPVTVAGKPSKLTVAQSFAFQSGLK